MNSFGSREMHKAVCSDCGRECEVPFKPTEGKPIRCSDCFRSSGPQRSFGSRRPQRPGFGNRGFGSRGFDRRPRETHKAVCAECNQECEVPFKPTEGKPIYCRECFAKKKGF